MTTNDDAEEGKQVFSDKELAILRHREMYNGVLNIAQALSEKLRVEIAELEQDMNEIVQQGENISAYDDDQYRSFEGQRDGLRLARDRLYELVNWEREEFDKATGAKLLPFEHTVVDAHAGKLDDEELK